MSDTTTTAGEYPSEMEPSALASWIASEVQKDWEAQANWREEARQAYEFVAGDQWSAEERATLAEGGRVPIVFNRTAPMIDAVAGAQVNNRQEMRVIPRSDDDNGTAETLQGVLSWIRDNCDAEDEESAAFVDAATGGVGWIETRMDYDETPSGKIVLERRDPFEMGWDRAARKRNLLDASRVWSRQKFSKDEVASRWPGFSMLRGADLPDVPGQTARIPTRDAYADGDASPAEDTDEVTVTHIQWVERRVVFFVHDAYSGQIEKLSAEAWEALAETLGEDERDALRNVRQTERCWYQAFECGGEVADLDKAPDEAGPSYKAITGRYDRSKRVFYGLIRAVIDPQKWANKWLSQSLHIVNTNVKSGWIYEDGAIEDVRKFEEDVARTGTLTKVNAGALTGGRMREKVPPPFPQAFDRLLQMAIASIPDVTGINREMLGTVDREQAGVLEAQRKQASQAVLAPLFDSLRRYYKVEGRLLLVFAGKFLDPQEVIRITGPGGKPEAVRMADLPDAAKYDLIIDEAPTSPNQKWEVWQALQPMLPVLIKQVPGSVLVKMLKFSPLPESVVQELAEDIENMSAQPKPPDPAVVKAQAEMQTTQAKTQADIALKQADMQHKQQLAAAQMEQQQQEFQMTMLFKRMEAEQSMALERMRAEQNAALAREEADRQAMTERHKASMQAEESVSRMKSERDVLAEPVREIMAPVQAVLGQMIEVLGTMQRDRADDAERNQAMLADLRRLVSAERELIRGPDGRVAGARLRQEVLN